MLRYFVRIGKKIVWADRPEELLEDLLQGQELPPGIDPPMPMSVTFIPATVSNNPGRRCCGLRQSTAPSEPTVSVARSAPPRSGWPLVCIMGTFRLETGSACGAPGARLLSDRVVRIAHV